MSCLPFRLECWAIGIVRAAIRRAAAQPESMPKSIQTRKSEYLTGPIHLLDSIFCTIFQSILVNNISSFTLRSFALFHFSLASLLCIVARLKTAAFALHRHKHFSISATNYFCSILYDCMTYYCWTKFNQWEAYLVADCHENRHWNRNPASKVIHSKGGTIKHQLNFHQSLTATFIRRETNG